MMPFPAVAGFAGRLTASELPVVFVNMTIDTPSVSWVDYDQELAGYMAVKHLIELGHRRIAVVAFRTEHVAIQQRVDGYMRAARGKRRSKSSLSGLTWPTVAWTTKAMRLRHEIC